MHPHENLLIMKIKKMRKSNDESLGQEMVDFRCFGHLRIEDVEDLLLKCMNIAIFDPQNPYFK